MLIVSIPVVVSTTRAKYSTSESIPLINGRVKYTPYDFKIMAMYQENDSGGWTEISKMPSSGYTINENKSYCYTTDPDVKDTTVVLRTDSEGNHEFNNLSKSSKCYLWFDEAALFGGGAIIANATSIGTRNDFSTVYTDSNTNLYTAEDDYGTSYYFAGAPTNNYVKFANKFWRIIRVNGDGTIRMIYAGTQAYANGTSSADAQTTTKAFNSVTSNNMYVGYMYEADVVHGLKTSSTIKNELDTWYENNLLSYNSFVDTNAGFCGDREPSRSYQASDGNGGTSTINTYYGADIRLSTNKTPNLKCTNSSDLYTKSESSKGNKALTYPIGLITADEVAYAGGVYYTNNTAYYLYTGQNYWTMTPAYFMINEIGTYGNATMVFHVSLDGKLANDEVPYEYGIRPVINLRADVTLTGEGTTSNPYVVS